MPTTNLDELLKTVTMLGKELHPDLDQGFIEAVIRAEEKFPEDDTEALQLIRLALKAALAAQKE
jgi:hypothetical protein